MTTFKTLVYKTYNQHANLSHKSLHPCLEPKLKLSLADSVLKVHWKTGTCKVNKVSNGFLQILEYIKFRHWYSKLSIRKTISQEATTTRCFRNFWFLRHGVKNNKCLFFLTTQWISVMIRPGHHALRRIIPHKVENIRVWNFYITQELVSKILIKCLERFQSYRASLYNRFFVVLL